MDCYKTTFTLHRIHKHHAVCAWLYYIADLHGNSSAVIGAFSTHSSGALDGFTQPTELKKSGCVRANRLKISVSVSQPLENICIFQPTAWKRSMVASQPLVTMGRVSVNTILWSSPPVSGSLPQAGLPPPVSGSSILPPGTLHTTGVSVLVLCCGLFCGCLKTGASPPSPPPQESSPHISDIHIQALYVGMCEVDSPVL